MLKRARAEILSDDIRQPCVRPRASRPNRLNSFFLYRLLVCHRLRLCPSSYLTNIMSAPSNHHDVTSPTHFQELLSADLSRVSLVYFWAPWAAPCEQMNELVIELARKHEALLVLRVEAEEQADIADSFDVESVPLFVVLRVRAPLRHLCQILK
jgi:thiol-disulfide isomerase/thioredoxin